MYEFLNEEKLSLFWVEQEFQERVELSLFIFILHTLFSHAILCKTLKHSTQNNAAMKKFHDTLSRVVREFSLSQSSALSSVRF